MKSKADYQRYMQSEAWVAFKTRYREAGWPWRCIACGDGRHIHLHHVTYVRLGDEDLRDVVPLCATCHDRLHATCTGAGKGGVPAFRSQLVTVFGLSEKESFVRMNRWRQKGKIGREATKKLKAEKRRQAKEKRKRDIAAMLEARARNGYAADGSRLPGFENN